MKKGVFDKKHLPAFGQISFYYYFCISITSALEVRTTTYIK